MELSSVEDLVVMIENVCRYLHIPFLILYRTHLSYCATYPLPLLLFRFFSLKLKHLLAV